MVCTLSHVGRAVHHHPCTPQRRGLHFTVTVRASAQGPQVQVHSGSDGEGGSQLQDMLLPPLPSLPGPQSNQGHTQPLIRWACLGQMYAGRRQPGTRTSP